VSPNVVAQVYFIYGLAFFSMGLAILLERGRASDPRLSQALRLLAFFGWHGGHEWLEMFRGWGCCPAAAGLVEPPAAVGVRSGWGVLAPRSWPVRNALAA
jgi:hypothetical protein